MFQQAIAGNVRAAAEIADRIEGKVTRATEITTPHPLPTTLEELDAEILELLKKAGIDGFIVKHPRRKADLGEVLKTETLVPASGGS